MLTPEVMLTLAAELTDAQADGDAESLGAISDGTAGEAGFSAGQWTGVLAPLLRNAARLP